MSRCPPTPGALAHAVQPEMSVERLTVDHALVDTAPIVRDTETKLTFVEANLHPDTARVCMVKGVAQGLDSDPVDLELHDGFSARGAPFPSTSMLVPVGPSAAVPFRHS